MKRLLLFILALVASVAAQAAPPAVLAWSAPTKFTNGAPISGAITYNVYQGAAGAEVFLAGGVAALTYTIVLPFTGTQCWQVTAVVAAQESVRSNEACKTAPLPVPNAPTGLTGS